MESTANTVNEEYMSPELSPDEPEASHGVRRVNNLPVLILGVAISIFLIIMVLVAADRANQQNKPETADRQKAGNANMLAKEIVGNNLGGIIPPESNPQPDPQVESAPPVKIVRADMPPTPPSAAPNRARTPEEDAAARIAAMKRQQFEDAIKARTMVTVTAPRSSGSPPGVIAASQVQTTGRDGVLAKLAAVREQMTDTDPMTAYKKRLAALQDSGIVGADGENETGGNERSPQLVSSETLGEKNNISQFGKSGSSDRWRLDSLPEAPRTPFELRAGFIIPGTLISGINSELPGQIMAQVSQDVFDTATGKYLLVPQGSRLVGVYSSEVEYGQSRVLVAWQRIVFPDGKAMDIGAMPGADSAGYAGFTDQVNHHFVRIFGSALLMSAITAGITYNQQQNQQNGVYTAPNANSAMSNALGQQLGRVTSQMIAKNMNIAPTLEIRPGYRFNIIVTKDLTLTKPYQAFDY
ncbi:conjugal transfer protein TrbI [Methylomonas methanica]|uniref:Conjugal transfer protein TrbI n=1 Tax=Methylomonas methanica TaxID=421 RepID=A0A177M743_METMH|nr:TrbI/VirB10 family protein [Methylomonas methanica]OAI00599.1 conjugal transfer protein TrbI [Methylomonas methanica]